MVASASTPDVHLLLGRVDGKLDVVIANQSAQYEKLELLVTRVSQTEIRLTTIETFDQSSKTHWAMWLSVGSLAVALGSLVKAAFGH